MPYTATDAKDICLYFLKLNGKQVTRSALSFQMIQAKKLLESYSVDEVMFTLDELISQGREVSSLGYLPYVIDKMIAIKRKREAQVIVDTLETPTPKEVNQTSNLDKVNKFGVKKDWKGWGGE
jgi:hypothetical protein